MRADILKLIPASTVRLGGCNGGQAELTGAMVSGAMGYARLSQDARLYRDIKHYHDTGKISKLICRVTKNYVLPLAIKKKWKCDVSILPRLTKAALIESLVPICGNCDGVGERLIDNQLHVCESCEGTGKTKISNARLARIVETDPKNFTRSWKVNRYYKILTYFYELDNEVDRSLGKIGKN